MPSYEKRTWWSLHGLTERLTDPSFLEAAVTGAFVIAAADGNASEQEYDALVDRLEILGGVDRDRIDELVTAAATRLEETGFDPLVARVAELVVDRAAGEAAFMLALAIALADDDVSESERELAVQLAGALGLASIDLDAKIAEIRG
jgi:tellurite resistance protein